MRALGDRHGEGIALANLGIVYRRQGRHEDARRLWREALTSGAFRLTDTSARAWNGSLVTIGGSRCGQLIVTNYPPAWRIDRAPTCPTPAAVELLVSVRW